MALARAQLVVNVMSYCYHISFMIVMPAIACVSTILILKFSLYCHLGRCRKYPEKNLS